MSDDSAVRSEIDFERDGNEQKTSKDSNHSEIINSHFEIHRNKTQYDPDDKKTINRSVDDIDERKQAFKRTGITKFSRKIHVRFKK